MKMPRKTVTFGSSMKAEKTICILPPASFRSTYPRVWNAQFCEHPENEALNLPIEARAVLAGSLLESLDEVVDENAEATWADEIARRIDDLNTGKAKTVPWSEAR